MSQLHLIPVPLSGAEISQLSQESIDISRKIRHFLAEKSKSARHYLKSINHPDRQQNIEVRELYDSDFKDNCQWLTELCRQNIQVGLLSEAGLPCVADPGFNIVMYAHKNQITVLPYSGPNSMLMTLMASGLNGQEFCFHGYLPRKKEELKTKLIQLNNLCSSSSSSQIFMETPYRNISLVESLLNHLSAEFFLSIGSAIGNKNQIIKTMKIKDWKKTDLKFLDDNPSIFILANNSKS